MKNMKIALALAAAMLTSMVTSTASAENITRNTTINATVASSCSMDPFKDPAIRYGVLSTIVLFFDLNIVCNQGAAYTVSLSDGHLSSDNGRVMKNSSGDELKYKINLPGALGDFKGENKLTGVGSGEKVKHTLDVEIFELQFVKPGTYVDSLTMELTY